MSRVEDLDEFYSILDKLRDTVGAKTLKTCKAEDGWPKRGVYFFFEEGEARSSHDQMRVVRVGTHALKSGSTSTFWGRLKQHKGNQRSGGGNHRSSVFRKHIGSSIIYREGLREQYPHWDDDSNTSTTLRNEELEMEKRVSEIIGAMPFLWVNVDDAPGPDSKRGIIERNSIALLSNYGTAVKLDLPSRNWLGRFSNEKIRESGLWNVNHVDEKYAPFLTLLEEQVTQTH